VTLALTLHQIAREAPQIRDYKVEELVLSLPASLAPSLEKLRNFPGFFHLWPKISGHSIQHIVGDRGNRPNLLWGHCWQAPKGQCYLAANTLVNPPSKKERSQKALTEIIDVVTTEVRGWIHDPGIRDDTTIVLARAL
jgi:hypothetical protein